MPCFVHNLKILCNGNTWRDTIGHSIVGDSRKRLACVASVSVRFRRKERGTRVKDRTKNGASKRAGRGWGRKEGRKRLQTNPSILKTPHLACHAWVHASTFDAGISCHNWPKCLSFRRAEMNFRGECETKVIFLVFWNAWTALMVKSQWIQTINVGPHQLFSCLFYMTNTCTLCCLPVSQAVLKR